MPPTRKSYLAVRGKDYFNRILRNVRAFRNLQEREGSDRPRVSAWLTGLKETVAELPAFVKVAAEIGVKEVYLQRLVFFENDAIGLARPDQALYEQLDNDESRLIEEATALAQSLGMTFSASGAASEPGMSLKRAGDGSPWSMCRRPWTVMYFTANGRALAVLHRAVLATGLRELHARRRDAADLERDLEWRRLPVVPARPAVRRAAVGVCELRPALEPLIDARRRDEPGEGRRPRDGERSRGRGDPDAE